MVTFSFCFLSSFVDYQITGIENPHLNKTDILRMHNFNYASRP